MENYQSKLFKTSCCWFISHFTIENSLKVEKKGILFRKQAQLSLPSERQTYQKLKSNNYGGTLSWKLFIASPGHWILSENIFPRHRGKREVCTESTTNFSSIHFFVWNATISRWRNFRNSVVWKKFIRDSRIWVDEKASDFVLSWTLVQKLLRADLMLISSHL